MPLMPSHRLLALMCWLIQESVVTYVAASAAEACPSLLQLGQHMQVGSMSAGKVNNYIDNSSNNTINNNNNQRLRQTWPLNHLRWREKILLQNNDNSRQQSETPTGHRKLSVSSTRRTKSRRQTW
mmetsp:Transcript_55998/g.90611  ORF Transcript_55998/g.90611 Transcript_55998/m.90611 type:complete len:125 (+) Transcript_55998:76-450(+)